MTDVTRVARLALFALAVLLAVAAIGVPLMFWPEINPSPNVQDEGQGAGAQDEGEETEGDAETAKFAEYIPANCADAPRDIPTDFNAGWTHKHRRWPQVLEDDARKPNPPKWALPEAAQYLKSRPGGGLMLEDLKYFIGEPRHPWAVVGHFASDVKSGISGSPATFYWIDLRDLASCFVELRRIDREAGRQVVLAIGTPQILLDWVKARRLRHTDGVKWMLDKYDNTLWMPYVSRRQPCGTAREIQNFYNLTQKVSQQSGPHKWEVWPLEVVHESSIQWVPIVLGWLSYFDAHYELSPSLPLMVKEYKFRPSLMKALEKPEPAKTRHKVKAAFGRSHPLHDKKVRAVAFSLSSSKEEKNRGEEILWLEERLPKAPDAEAISGKPMDAKNALMLVLSAGNPPSAADESSGELFSSDEPFYLMVYVTRTVVKRLQQMASMAMDDGLSAESTAIRHMRDKYVCTLVIPDTSPADRKNLYKANFMRVIQEVDSKSDPETKFMWLDLDTESENEIVDILDNLIEIEEWHKGQAIGLGKGVFIEMVKQEIEDESLAEAAGGALSVAI